MVWWCSLCERPAETREGARAHLSYGGGFEALRPPGSTNGVPPPSPGHLYTGRTFRPPASPEGGRGPLVRKTKRQGSSTGAANKQASSPTPLPPPRTRNFCAIAHEHDGVSGPAQCGHDATRGEAKASSAGWNTHCHTHTQSHTPRVRTPPRPRTIGNARSRSRSRKGGESARPILSPAGTPLRALTLLSEERSDGALSAYAPRSHARGRARTYCTVVG